MRRLDRSRAAAAAGGPAGAAFGLSDEIAQLRDLDLAALLVRWRNHVGGEPPRHLPKYLILRMIAFQLQENAYGGLPVTARRLLERLSGSDGPSSIEPVPAVLVRSGLRPGTLLTREWQGELHRVMVLEGGFAWNGVTHKSLSEVARAITGTRWSGPKFFGLAAAKTGAGSGAVGRMSNGAQVVGAGRRRPRNNDVIPPADSLACISPPAAGDVT